MEISGTVMALYPALLDPGFRRDDVARRNDGCLRRDGVVSPDDVASRDGVVFRNEGRGLGSSGKEQLGWLI